MALSIQVVALVDDEMCINCGKCFMTCNDSGYQVRLLGRDSSSLKDTHWLLLSYEEHEPDKIIYMYNITHISYIIYILLCAV